MISYTMNRSGLNRYLPWVGTCLFLVGILSGCAGIKKPDEGISAGLADKTEGMFDNEKSPEIKIREYLLSPGDEIKINVFPQEDFTRRLIIPLEGYIFYPLLGEIKVEGKSIKELREIILNGLSSYRKSYLMPGDEISIAIYRHAELSRRLIIPPEGYFFYPLVGEIKVEGKNLKQVREIIAAKLSKYIVNPQVEVALVSTEVPKMIVDPQVSIEVVGFGGQKIFVLGEVKSPGVFLADGQIGVLEAITKAGGPTLDAKQESILLIRGGMNNPKPELITLNLKNFWEEGGALSNIILKRDDVIYVPRTFISNVDRFFQHLAIALTPLYTLERGIYTGQLLERGVGATPSP